MILLDLFWGMPLSNPFKDKEGHGEKITWSLAYHFPLDVQFSWAPPTPSLMVGVSRMSQRNSSRPAGSPEDRLSHGGPLGGSSQLVSVVNNHG